VGWAMSFIDASIQWADMVSNVKADIVYCNDIDTLLCGVAHKKKYGSRLIYDTHDIFCDMFPGIFPRQHRNLIGRLEKSLLTYADMLISVNDSANRWIKGTYHSNVSAVAILNCTDDIVKASFNAKEPSDKLKIYYHGGCDATRGLENIITAIALTSDIQLVLRLLPSEYEKTLRQLVKELNLIDRVSFLEPVDSVMSASAAHSDGDIGIHACDNIKCIDLELSLTNKFIEYLRAGLPVITSDVIEQASIVRKYDAGYVLANNSPEEIARVFEIAKSEKSSYKQKSENALRASKELFDWNKYKPLLQKAVFNEFDNDELIKMAEIKPLKAAEKLNETDCLKQELRVWQDEFKRQVLAREYAINVKEQKEIEAQKKEESIIAKYEMQLLQMESIARQKDELLKETTNKYETIVKDKLKEIDNISNILRETQEKNKMQLDEIYASASWKLTKPLRSIARKFK
ncbi:MAG: glycosyltransferase, partial [Oscillospiraceae bacterium]